MASKRQYPLKTCANPNCETDFTPHDKRQRFCTPNCNDNFHNDQRSLNEKSLKVWLMERDRADKKLEVAYLYLDYHVEPIDDLMLSILQIDLSLASIEKSSKTGKEVFWFNQFGLQKIENTTNYILINRNNI